MLAWQLQAHEIFSREAAAADSTAWGVRDLLPEEWSYQDYGEIEKKKKKKKNTFDKICP